MVDNASLPNKEEVKRLSTSFDKMEIKKSSEGIKEEVNRKRIKVLRSVVPANNANQGSEQKNLDVSAMFRAQNTGRK